MNMSDRPVRSWRLWLLLGAAAYASLYTLEFLQTPAGQCPVLDGAENVMLARQIAAGTLVREPFYRAMLYPFLLSLFLRMGMTADLLPYIAGLIGVACHVVSVLCVGRLATRLWGGRPAAGAMAAGLFAFYPVAVFFAAEPLDTALGLALFLAGLDALHLAALSAHPARAGAGMAALSLAAMARPNYMPCVIVAPLLVLLLSWTTAGTAARRWRLAAAAVIPTLVLWMGLGVLQLVRSGVFRVTPWQGTYSLWSGNRPRANGRYYEQQMVFRADPGGAAEMNVSRMESEVLYARETGKDPKDLLAMERYWRAKTLDTIRAEPGRWLGLELRKLYYLFNNFEQYNNKTYAFHKARSVVLGWNPLGWGVVFVLGVMGLTAGCLSGAVRLFRRDGAGWWLVAGVAASYAAGVLLFFASDRFRLPLAPVCMAMAGGLCLLPNLQRRPGAAGVVLAAGGAAALLTFSGVWEVRDLRPVTQDMLLLSNAALKVGKDEEACRWAVVALTRAPGQPNAVACLAQSFYNLQLQGEPLPAEAAGLDWPGIADLLGSQPQPSGGLRLIHALALWKTGDAAGAGVAWRALCEQPSASPRLRDNALGMLLLAGLGSGDETELAVSAAPSSASAFLRAAAVRRSHQVRLDPVEQQCVERLFPPTSDQSASKRTR
jgi:hypothetical protein